MASAKIRNPVPPVSAIAVQTAHLLVETETSNQARNANKIATVLQERYAPHASASADLSVVTGKLMPVKSARILLIAPQVKHAQVVSAKQISVATDRSILESSVNPQSHVQIPGRDV